MDWARWWWFKCWLWWGETFEGGHLGSSSFSAGWCCCAEAAVAAAEFASGVDAECCCCCLGANKFENEKPKEVKGGLSWLDIVVKGENADERINK